MTKELIVSTTAFTRRLNFGHGTTMPTYLPSDGRPLPVQQSGKSMGIAITLPISKEPDPNSTAPWEGYLLGENKMNTMANNAHPEGIAGTSLVYEIGCIAPLVTRFNFQRDADNQNGPNPLAFHPLLKKNAMNNNGDGDRWWSYINYPLVPGKDSGLVRLVIPLDPSAWFNVSGARADQYMSGADFKATLAKPWFYGGSFGGGWFCGHGGNSVGGPAKFCIYRMYTQ